MRPDPANDRRHATRTLWLCGLLHAFTHLYAVALVPLYLAIQADFKLPSVVQATLLLTVMMVAYFVPSYPMGVLADRMSRKRLLGLGLAINALGFIGMGLAPSYPVALTCAALAGFGGSFYHPAATALVAQLFPVNTGRALGIAGVGASVGFCLGPMYAGWRAQAAGWRAPLLELGLGGLAAAALFAWLAEDRPGPVRKARAEHSRLFPTRALWGWFLAAAILFSLRDFAGGSMGSLSSLFLQRAHGMSMQTTGMLVSAIFIGSIVSNPLFGHFSDRGRRRWTSLVLVAGAGLVATFPHVPRGWLAPALIAYGFFFLASYPMVEAALMLSVPDAARGRVFGAFITIAGLLGNLAHWQAGVWVGRMGPAAADPARYYDLYAGLAGLIVLSLLALPCLHAIRQREGLDSGDSPPTAGPQVS
jgi:MFS family permease